MRNLPIPAGAACFAITCGLIVAPEVVANVKPGYNFATGSVCQLSIPTTDTKFRPKATGARNESSTASNFVICPLRNTVTDNDSTFDLVSVAVYSIDGSPHGVTCTAVSGWNGRGLQYSTKTYDVSGSNGDEGRVFTWSYTDFPGSSGGVILNSAGFSVTCNLAPQTAINYIQGLFTYDVGT